MGRKVWFHELFEFLFKTKQEKDGPRLSVFMGSMFAGREYSMTSKGKRLASSIPTIDTGEG
jgi:anaerobic magnesium-protoporphyrin IX monomethyl ester cyclase